MPKNMRLSTLPAAGSQTKSAFRVLIDAATVARRQARRRAHPCDDDTPWESSQGVCGERRLADLLDLIELQINRGLTTEDGHQGLKLLVLHIDGGDRRGHRGERTGEDGDSLTDMEVHGDLLR